MASLKTELLNMLAASDQEHARLISLIEAHDKELKAQRAFIEELSEQLKDLQNAFAQL
ncbi:MAG: hypothetical protein AAFY31_02635 [Pseudomonadota bacterium]